MKGPLVPEVGIVSLGPDDWSDLWQPRHQVMVRLSRYFHVVWVNPARDLQWVFKRDWKCGPCVERHGGLTVYSPQLWLPMLHWPGYLADFTFRHRIKNAYDLLGRLGVSKRVLYVWRPDFAEALNLADFDASCYHVDDEYSFSEVEVPIPEAEVRLLSAVDQVFVHSPGLLERKGRFNPNTQMIPNGVDFHAYSQPYVEPPDLAAIPGPRIGYSGWLKKHLDWHLLIHLSDIHPDWSFVFVGPISPHAEVARPLEELKRRRNVYLLGSKSTKDLASYPQHFDVCIMPYAMNDYTKYIYPLKLHEYLAAGRPTVGTRIRTLENFSAYVGLAATPKEWSAAICEALRPDANMPERTLARQALARQHDWEILVRKIAATLAQRLGPEYVHRLDAS